MQVIKLLERSYRRLRLFFCGFLRGQPPLGMHLGFRKSRRIQNQPQVDYSIISEKNLIMLALRSLAASIFHNSCFV